MMNHYATKEEQNTEMNMWTFWQPVMNVLLYPTKEEQNIEMNMWMFWQPVMNVLL